MAYRDYEYYHLDRRIYKYVYSIPNTMEPQVRDCEMYHVFRDTRTRDMLFVPDNDEDGPKSLTPLDWIWYSFK